MKKMMAGLKGFKAKELLLNHGEKLAFGSAVLVVVLALAGTEWSRYARTPQEIISKVQESKARIDASVWPADKQATFGLQDYAGRAQELRGPLQLSRHEFSTNMWWPLYRKQELAKEPELLAVTDLIATSGVMAFGIVPKAATSELVADADGENMKKADDTEIDKEFAPVVRGAGATGPGGAFSPPGGYPGGGAGGMPDSAHAGGVGGNLAPATTAEINPYVNYGGYGGEGEGMMGSMGPTMESRGERFIAVRGVWPIWRQMEKFQQALNLQSTSDARNYLQLLDFVLERQTAVAGSDPWTGPWDTVDVQRAMDVLSEAYDFAIDPVDPQITDVTITMPLPARLVGQWGDYATHPKIANFILPKAELERETKLHEKLVEEFEKFRLKEEAKRIKPKGFANLQRNIRSMAETMFNSEYSEQISTEMGQWGQENSVRMALPDLKARLTAVGRLVLFRYFDFDVRPGYAYRYRVKLVLRNPNFERPLDQVIDQSVAEGQERETPYSNISNASVVPESVNYFLKEVERDPVNDQRASSSRPLARIDFFEWDATVGTMIRDTIELTTFGQFISDTKKTLQLNVATPSLKDTEVTFRSDDMLVDAIADVRLDAEIHKDLKLPATLRGKAGLTPEMLVMDEGGELHTLDPATGQTKRSELARYVERERAPFKDIENKEAQPAGMEGGYYPGMESADSGMLSGEMYGGYGGPQGKGRGKKKNPRKAGGTPGGAH